MGCENQTAPLYFVLLGIPYPPILHVPLCFFFVCIYLLTLLSNILVLFAIVLEPQLHKPMYWFLCNMSILDIATSTVIVPKVIAGFWEGGGTISLWGCILQLFFYHFVGCTECFLYTVMAYDRFLAICRPLHYGTLMSRKSCLGLALGTWVGGCLHSVMETALTFRLPYGQDNAVSYIFCDIPALLKLACADTALNQMVTLVDVGVVALTCVFLMLTSYVYIISAVLRINSADGRRRAFSTCTSHVIVVMICYVPLFFTYFRPGPRTH